jgi:predicted XRE-type DNA-binding protein
MLARRLSSALYLRRTPLLFLHTRAMSQRTYTDAITRLNTLQSNVATLDALRASGGRMSEFAIPEMLEYLARIGYQVRLRVRPVCYDAS